MADPEIVEEIEDDSWFSNEVAQLIGLALLLAATRGGGGAIAARGGIGAVGRGYGAKTAARISSKKGTAIIGSGGLLAIIDNWFFNRGDDDEEVTVDQALENGVQEIVEAAGPITSADQRDELANQISSSTSLTPEEAHAKVTEIADQQFLEAPKVGPRDPSGQTTTLVTDAYLNASMNPVTFAFNTTTLPYKKGADPYGMRGGQEYTGMMGTQDIQFFGMRPQAEGGGRGGDPSAVTELTWRRDKSRLPDGFEFISIVEKDAPFTLADAMGIFDKQDDEGKRLIAQGLTLGDGSQSFMFDALGQRMFSNPDSIYERDSVEAAMIVMQGVAASKASNYPGGFKALGDRYNPTNALNEPSSLGSFQDNLFDMAVDSGLVTQIGAEYGQELSERALANLTGLDYVEGFSEMVSGWIKDIQRKNMGRRLSQDEIITGLEAEIEDTPELAGAISASGMATRRGYLGQAMARKRS